MFCYVISHSPDDFWNFPWFYSGETNSGRGEDIINPVSHYVMVF